jgi:FkbM family methyltransferase
MTGQPWQFYSQSGEDFLLKEFFGGKGAGFFVDVGAFDGVHVSNTYAFERAGWTGICVEANPTIFEHCRRARPGSICVHAACVGDGSVGQIRFLQEPLGLLSGVAPDEEDVRRRYENRGLKFDDFTIVEVPARTLTALLDEHCPAGTPVDFLSLDVEGTELEILRGLDFSRHAPRVLVVEANTAEARAELVELLARHGYREARRLEVNSFFVRGDDDAERLRAIRLDCWLEATDHPLGPAYTMAAARTRRHVGPETEARKSRRERKSPLRRLLKRLGL